MFDRVHEDFLAGREYELAAEDRRRAAGPPYMDHTQAHVLFVDRVLSWHQPVTRAGAIPVCSCGQPARRCPYLESAREFFPHRFPLPWHPLAESERAQS